ncbi:hypothetical protein MPTK1_7g06630 [Marchantia polymorpha subsp. ruderalis]|uniref:SMP domain-containing protein n=2 Tax=Marchantia polymorpha TaxID=3197 RepID=A0A176W6I1_MARPO|nr:hypothetical protein AXG93_4577s1030 [Marchantia polymorpha subsp. ruderalis]PTQ37361.1 hypothetical protein MARPO_0057s0004 [Marchantia polymorpha]BBN16476.1 hypothetical protein Mp_7g06630 [Marchantia polymorpha subsp. ruderalis]|eukprot:PTQ37361.1 hypothetical protein MARPO_0057s0004 [Marchantia polymorpha]
MSLDQQQRPVTYGDVFPESGRQGEPVASQPVTLEDAALMQSAESLAFGRTQKAGAASAMQAAASRNVDRGLVDRNAHSLLSEYGMSVTQTSIPGVTMDISYVAGSPVQGSTIPTPTDPGIINIDAVTIGEALEAAAVGAGDKVIDESDARAILSAEARATGVSKPVRGGVGSVAQSAAELNHRVVNASEQTTLADVLMDATVALPADKVVTHADAEKVIQAEMRCKPHSEGLAAGGVAAAIAAAADLNERHGLIPPALEHINHKAPEPLGNVEEVGKFYPVDNLSAPSPSELTREQSADDGETSLLNSSGSSDQLAEDRPKRNYHEQLEGLDVPRSPTPDHDRVSAD